DQDAVAVMRACGVDVDLLRQELMHYIDAELQNLVHPASEEAKPTSDAAGPFAFLRFLAGRQNFWGPKEARKTLGFENVASEEAKPTSSFQRVLRRAAIHVQSSGREEVTGANVLVALFSEGESNAVYFLQEQEMTRFDAVIYIVHGIVKVPGKTESRGTGADKGALADTTASDASCAVYLLNDDYTPMDFVVQVLEKFFDKTRQEATQLMLQIHRMGMAVCGIYPYVLAVAKVNLVMDYARKNEHPLQCTMEKE
ncbi:MAG: ATP-dependent Clp protease adapter ClpS, partial [Alphaproteobacteria bacterium]